MSGLFDICSLIERGGIYTGIPGNTAEEIYENLFKIVPLPECCKRINVAEELIARERILSTAVGNGVAIPHPRRPLMKTEKDQRIIVCYPENPVGMRAPDRKAVYAMFIILAESSKLHLEALSSLAKALKSSEFRSVLETRPNQYDLLVLLKKYAG